MAVYVSMARTTALFTALVLIAGLSEYWFARRWYGRRSRFAAVMVGSMVSGSVWLAFVLALTELAIRSKPAVDHLGIGDYLAVTIMLTVDLALAVAISMIPAWIVAAVYWRRRDSRGSRREA